MSKEMSLWGRSGSFPEEVEARLGPENRVLVSWGCSKYQRLVTSAAGICCLTVAEAGKSKVKVSVGLVCSSNQEGRICSRPLLGMRGSFSLWKLPWLSLCMQMCTCEHVSASTFPLRVRTTIILD